MRIDSLRDLLRDIILLDKEEIRLLEELKRECPTETFALGATKDQISYLKGKVAAFEFVAQQLEKGGEE